MTRLVGVDGNLRQLYSLMEEEPSVFAPSIDSRASKPLPNAFRFCAICFLAILPFAVYNIMSDDVAAHCKRCIYHYSLLLRRFLVPINQFLGKRHVVLAPVESASYRMVGRP